MLYRGRDMGRWPDLPRRGDGGISGALGSRRRTGYLLHNPPCHQPCHHRDRDSARGLWHMLALVIEHGDALWTAGLYDNLYVRTPSGWKIQLMKYEPWFWSRHSQGWATERFRDFEAELRLAAS
ncbi:MAG: hypothetical protein EOP84_10640 [Verrucomicrobiaceae bacterium]|nr:MAG: hypothetical protein EOP84_10640 [Verrucomicrobiaceae bacterium]